MSDAAKVSELLARFRSKDRAALNRLISLVARGEAIDKIRDALGGTVGHARVTAFTGNSGVGKSSLIARLIELIRSRGKTVAVLACDPESALTGGALLGDRVRMSAHAADEGVWIRSLAAASGRQAVADHLDLAAQLLGRYGFDHIFLETVGAGQADVAVESLADVVVLLIQPEIGDELQWEKAGVLEVADLVVLHKGDLPGAERTESQVRELLNLPESHETPVIRVSSKTNAGIAELWSLIEALPVASSDAQRNTRALLRLVQEHVADSLTAHANAVRPVVDDWKAGRLTGSDAVEQALAMIVKRSQAFGKDKPSDAT